MADSKDYMTLSEENGSIHIAEEVIAAIAVGAVREVEGVSGMMTNLGGSVADLVNNKKNAQKGAKGVKIDMTPDALVHQGEWARCNSFCFWRTPQMELAGKNLGIIGFGRIGKAVAKIARALGMNILAYSRSESPEGLEIAQYVTLEELLANSDIISLHCPLFPETEKMINKDTISRMKDGVILLNTSRGGLLDESAVAEALYSGKILAAAVDVVSQEPITNSNPLLSAPNCIITPHMAWAPIESRKRLMACVAENIRCYLDGNPQNVVN
jgi:glycerate dehydrogenase